MERRRTGRRAQLSLSQPTIAPLTGTRSILESLARWSGQPKAAYDILRSHWQNSVHSRSTTTQPFQDFWDRAVHDGFVDVACRITPQPASFRPDTVKLVARAARSERFHALRCIHKIGLTDSRHAHNPWLQELPDPVTKVTWDNYVCISPAAAAEQGLSDGDVVRVAAKVGGRKCRASRANSAWPTRRRAGHRPGVRSARDRPLCRRRTTMAGSAANGRRGRHDSRKATSLASHRCSRRSGLQILPPRTCRSRKPVVAANSRRRKNTTHSKSRRSVAPSRRRRCAMRFRKRLSPRFKRIHMPESRIMPTTFRAAPRVRRRLQRPLNRRPLGRRSSQRPALVGHGDRFE